MSPVCGRCKAPAVYIGIGPAAELACKYDCEGRCPKCYSIEVEPFTLWNGFGTLSTAASDDVMHCLACGRLFEQDGTLKGYDDGEG